jgi:uncharacterized LabA/DUF88 family protein
MQDSHRWAMYIDGYNFYYAIKHRPTAIPLHLGWCDFGRLGDLIVGERGRLLQIGYFTASVDNLGASDGELGGEAARQATWLRAVSSIKRLTIVRGFHSRERSRDSRESEKRRTEKQTDVNIAVALVRDAALARYDSAILVTSDSDQIPAVRSATKDFGRSIEVWLPPGQAVGRWAECQPIRRIQVASITREMLEVCRLPDTIRIGQDSVEAPPSWRSSSDSQAT